MNRVEIEFVKELLSKRIDDLNNRARMLDGSNMLDSIPIVAISSRINEIEAIQRAILNKEFEMLELRFDRIAEELRKAV